MGQSVLFKFVRVDLASFGDIEFYSGDFWFSMVSTLLEFWQRLWTYCRTITIFAKFRGGFLNPKVYFLFQIHLVFVIKKPNLSNL